MKSKFWVVDRVWVCIKGKNAQRFASAATENRIRIAHLRPEKEGFIAQVFGADLHLLEQIAKKETWEITVWKRRGPGRFVEQLTRRPGIPVGILLFGALLPFLTSFVWTIDFGVLEAEQQERLRTLLADYGVHEGVWLTEDHLEQIQIAALQQSDLFGWISLNFTAGCLSVESTDAQYQTIRKEPSMQALYAKAEGKILTIETQSGFTVVKPGQQVEKGQLLVDVVRLDRKGEAVPQGASGEIIARIRKSYTSYRPFQVNGRILAGASDTQVTYTFMGCTWMAGEKMLPAGAKMQTTWEPLRVGRVTLPGCICIKTVWQEKEQLITYTQEQAQALARLDCREQLYADFPDAVIEAEERTFSNDKEGSYCTITYDFRANIAQTQF